MWMAANWWLDANVLNALPCFENLQQVFSQLTFSTQPLTIQYHIACFAITDLGGVRNPMTVMRALVLLILFPHHIQILD
jgi:hypothetical protein